MQQISFLPEQEIETKEEVDFSVGCFLRNRIAEYHEHPYEIIDETETDIILRRPDKYTRDGFRKHRISKRVAAKNYYNV